MSHPSSEERANKDDPTGESRKLQGGDYTYTVRLDGHATLTVEDCHEKIASRFLLLWH
jgi:hypothetical protein